MKKLEDWVGQQLMIGVKGTAISPEMVRLFEETRAGGLIIYRPNFASAELFQKMITELEKALGRRLLIAVDHEGGRVIHLAEGVTAFPDNRALGVTGSEEFARKQGEIEARELRRLGIDVNLAPTLDVLTKNFSPNIGIRSYGEDPELVAKLGRARIEAMQANGLSACAKHFPGQGHSPLDAHLDLAVLAGNWDEMEKVHLKPFWAAIEAGVDSIMSSHPVYPFLDLKKVPATFSRRIIYDCLRRELGFEGVIFSDDLEMGALRGICSIGESAVRAVAAGHDMVLIGHDTDAAKEAFRSLCEAYRNKKLDMRELETSVRRVEALKRKRCERFSGGSAKTEAEGADLAKRIARQAICVSENFSNHTFSTKSAIGKKIAVIFPRLSDLQDKIFIEKSMRHEDAFIRSGLAECGIENPEIRVVGFDPSEEELRTAISCAETADAVLFFCFDAHLFKNTHKLLEALQKLTAPLAVVLLRDFYDEEFLREGAARIHTFGFREVQIRAAFEQIFRTNAIC